MEHELKCVEPYYSEVEAGIKPYEIRFDDRNYKVGDTLWLRRYLPEKECFDGRSCRRKVIQVLKKFVGLAPGYVALGLEMIRQSRKWGPEDVIGYVHGGELWPGHICDLACPGGITVYLKDLPQVQAALQAGDERDMTPILEEMDALAYAVLDNFPANSVSRSEWLKERKADYARLHAASADKAADSEGKK